MKSHSVLPKLASVSDLQRNYAEIIADAKKSGEPVYLMKQNKPEALLMSIEAFENMYNKVKEYEEKEADEMLRDHEYARKNGLLRPFTSIEDLLKQ